jgi:5-methylcytosine-specific restriction endonuclease McrA
MSASHAKPVCCRLEPNLYNQIRLQVLRRDAWRCQECGIMSNLEVHHIEFRSHSGGDSEENLITLCAACHHEIHHVVKVK